MVAENTGNGKTVKVPQRLREILLRIGAAESTQQVGAFSKEHLDTNANVDGMQNVGFGPDEMGKMHPEGLCSFFDGVTNITDEAELVKYPFFATFIRERNAFIAEMKKAAGIPVETEDPVKEEISVGRKSIDQVNAEMKAKYAENKPTVIGAPTTQQSAKSEASSMPAVRKQDTQVTPAPSNAPALNNSFMGTVQDVPQELVVTLGGKKYATKNFRWLAFHALGLKCKKQTTEVIRWGDMKGADGEFIAKVRSIIIVDDGTPEGQHFEALGEARPDTVSDMIFGDHFVKNKNGSQKIDQDGNPIIKHVNHLDQMAETRAENRCIGKIIAGGWRPGANANAQEIQAQVKQVEQCTAEELAQFEGDESGD